METISLKLNARHWYKGKYKIKNIRGRNKKFTSVKKVNAVLCISDFQSFYKVSLFLENSGILISTKNYFKPIAKRQDGQSQIMLDFNFTMEHKCNKDECIEMDKNYLNI